MTFRLAVKNDLPAIAALHAQSWQSAYANVLSAEFLREEVNVERLNYWRKKFAVEQTEEKRCLLLAEEAGELAGFICVIGEADAAYGSLIDNLHVRPDRKGRGLGKQLLERGLAWAREHFPDCGQYLWVYKANVAAVGFYEKTGGHCTESVLTENPDGGRAEVWRMVWPKTATAIERRKNKVIKR